VCQIPLRVVVTYASEGRECARLTLTGYQSPQVHDLPARIRHHNLPVNKMACSKPAAVQETTWKQPMLGAWGYGTDECDQMYNLVFGSSDMETRSAGAKASDPVIRRCCLEALFTAFGLSKYLQRWLPPSRTFSPSLSPHRIFPALAMDGKVKSRFGHNLPLYYLRLFY
jgi:hypothetical protein